MATGYTRPQNIANDMGGENGKYDFRMQEIMDLLAYAPDDIGSILDVGMGKGQISEFFLNKGVKVTGTGLELESYGVEIEEWKKKGVSVVECTVENMPFADGEFDAVVASHILEHVPNMGLALQEIRRVLKNDKWLCLFIPHFEIVTTAGHINTGWNIGQLIYVLCLNGFNVKEGKFIRYGYSICAYVKKADYELPALRGDRGDIQILDDAGLFPFQVPMAKRGDRDAFMGEIRSINWPDAEKLIKKYEKKQKQGLGGKTLECLAKFLIKISRRHAQGLAIRILRNSGKYNPDCAD